MRALGMLRISAALAITVCVFTMAIALADSYVPPSSYTRETRDGKYLFVMVSPLPPEIEVKGKSEPYFSTINEIRKTYSQSGLYYNNGSTTPLWTVEWFADYVEPLSDGIHLVRHGGWASTYQQEAVSFFAKGKLLARYSVADLVANPEELPHTVSHFFWMEYGKLIYQSKHYFILTKNGEFHLFDLTTGQKLNWMALITWWALGGTFILLLGFVLHKLWIRFKHA